ncbi:hypothetical protein LCGC14_2609760, partial [marine sediment metagenome]
MEIILAKNWTDGDKTYKSGTVLDVDDQVAKDLCWDETASRYKGTELVNKTDPEANTEGFMLKLSDEQMKTLIRESVVQAIESATGKTKEVRLAETDADYMKQGGFKNFGHFLHDLWKAGPDGRSMSPEMQKWSEFYHSKPTMQEGDDEQGGYLVPTEFMATLLEKQQETAVIRSRATYIPMQTNSIQIPYVAESSRASSLFGGIIIYRPGEAESKTASKPAFGRLQLTLKKLVGLVDITDELLEDSPISIAPLINRMFGQAITFTEEEDFINGTGVGQALGILASGALVTVAKEGGQAAATIVAANIVKMFSRLHPPSYSNAIWMANMGTFPQLSILSIAVGTGGTTLWQPANGLAGAPNQTIMGLPLFLTEHCQALGTVGDIVLA